MTRHEKEVTKASKKTFAPKIVRAKNPLDYVITVMSQRTGAIGYWDGEHFDDDMRKAYHAADKTELETILAKIKKTLPKGWVVGLQPMPVHKPRMINPKKRGTSDDLKYDAALNVWRDASKKFGIAQASYRARVIGDSEFIAARKVLDAASYAFDSAETEFINSQNKAKPSRKKNPVPASKYLKIKQAIERFKDFTGMDPEHLDEYAVQHPDVALVIGTLDAVSYTTVREGQTELYEHKFKKSCRPLLCTSFDGKQLVILGGEYTFTERGIVDEG